MGLSPNRNKNTLSRKRDLTKLRSTHSSLVCSLQGDLRVGYSFYEYSTLKQPDPFTVTLARGRHRFPFRTRQLRPSAPMILHGQLCGKVGRRRDPFTETSLPNLMSKCLVQIPKKCRQRGNL